MRAAPHSGVEMDNAYPTRGLARLSDVPFQVAEGEPDIRGWPVYASTGREVGTVAELLVDPEAAEVVMLDVDLRGNDQHTL
ncbi:MAG: PRC-barrel domain-containing protein, partial [Candidatus Eremiobacteraeota bacterium]|nr:PRC-barrel domain-containing protein [Candidatus Eremiobacteraeota bacterium]